MTEPANDTKLMFSRAQLSYVLDELLLYAEGGTGPLPDEISVQARVMLAAIDLKLELVGEPP